MINFKEKLEVERINKAIYAFAIEMKRVMAERAKAGKRGWDKSMLSEHHVASKLLNDANDVYEDTCIAWRANTLTRLVDIANRCMILWSRYQQEDNQTQKD